MRQDYSKYRQLNPRGSVLRSANEEYGREVRLKYARFPSLVLYFCQRT